MTLGENLRALRKEAGLSQEEVAGQLYVSRQTISKWENNLAEPGVENLKALAKLYGITLDQLLGEEVRQDPPDLSEADLSQGQQESGDGSYLICTGVLLVLIAVRAVFTLDVYSSINIPFSLAAMVVGIWVRHPAVWVVVQCLLGLNAVLAFLSLFFGSFLLGRFAVAPGTLFRILWDALREWVCKLFGAEVPGELYSGQEKAVVLNIRLPRVALSALVGAGLSVAGTAYQGMFRNPMVSPDILGASNGAGFGAALGILLSFNYFGVTVSAFVCGVGAVALAWCISRASRMNGTLAMVLAGIVVGSLFSAGTSFIKLVADTEQQLPAITYWLMGSLSSAKTRDLQFALIPALIGMVPLFLLRWRINLLTLGEEEARSLGVHTTRLRLVIVVCATLITSACVSVSGMIGWVGLVIPHFARMLFGHDYKRLIPASMLLGGAFLMVVDNIARLATSGEIPLGILTSVVGAPVFVWLILRGGADREH